MSGVALKCKVRDLVFCGHAMNKKAVFEFNFSDYKSSFKNLCMQGSRKFLQNKKNKTPKLLCC